MSFSRYIVLPSPFFCLRNGNLIPITGFIGGNPQVSLAITVCYAEAGPMSIIGGWSQRIDATLYLIGKRWSVTMDQRFRRGFTAAEKTELWDRWQRGESLKAIGRAFGKPSSSIYCQVAPHGGIRPAPRRRSRLALTLPEREEISRGIAVHQSARSMARLLGRSP